MVCHYTMPGRQNTMERQSSQAWRQHRLGKKSRWASTAILKNNMYKYGNYSEKNQDTLIKYWLLQPVLVSSLATLLVTTHHLTAAGNTCGGDLVFSISSDSWRQLTRVGSAVASLLPGHVQKVPTTPSFWEAIRALLAEMTTMSTMTENVPQINFTPIFQALAYAHAHLPRTPEVGFSLKKDF